MPDKEHSRDTIAPRLDDLVQGIWEESTRLETVLVVHGYPSLREALVRTLEHYGYRAVEASTREQALRVVRRESVDLVLLDFDLGEGDGPVLAAEITERRETCSIPVIALSSDVVPRDALRLSGVGEALVMPVEQKDLVAALDRSLARARSESRTTLRLEPVDEQCRLPLEDRLRSEHVSLFFRFPARTRIELREANEGLLHHLSARLADLSIRPEIRVENGDLVLQYELTVADALALEAGGSAIDLFSALVEAFPELAIQPDRLRRRLAGLDAEYRRLQRVAS